MKHLLLLVSFVFATGFISAQEAQSVKTCTKAEQKACAKKGVTCAKTASAEKAGDTNVLSALAEADLAAEGDNSIVRKECPKSGKVSYYQEAVCEKSGKVSMTEMKYCTKSSAFVNASPSDMAKDVEAKVIKTADTADGKVQSASKSSVKKCCKGKKACGSKKTGA